MHKKLKVLVIGAHPDDCEIRVGGIALKYRALGHDVKFIYATNGDAGHHILKGEELAKIREEEIKNACAIAGIEYEIMDNHDAYLDVSIPLRDKFIKLIREYAPDIIITHRPNDYHPDHRNASVLVQDASFLLIVPSVCPETPALKEVPIIVHMQDNFKKPLKFSPDITIGIDDTIDTKIQMLHCHTSQFYEWLAYSKGILDEVPESEEERIKWLFKQRATVNKDTADKYREELISRYGASQGKEVEFAEALEICEYGRQVSNEELSVYFPF